MSSALTSLATGAVAGAAQQAKEKAQNVAITTALKQAPGGDLLATIYNSFKDVGRKMKALYQGLSPGTKTIFLAVIIIIIIVGGIFSPIIFSTIISKLPISIIPIVENYDFYIKLLLLFIIIYILYFYNFI